MQNDANRICSFHVLGAQDTVIARVPGWVVAAKVLKASFICICIYTEAYIIKHRPHLKVRKRTGNISLYKSNVNTYLVDPGASQFLALAVHQVAFGADLSYLLAQSLPLAGRVLDAREDVGQETVEEGDVLGHKLRNHRLHHTLDENLHTRDASIYTRASAAF